MINRQDPQVRSDLRQAERPYVPEKPAADPHVCVDCHVDISHLRRDAQRCKPCANVRKKTLAKLDYLKNSDKIKKRSRNYYHNNREPVLQNVKIYQSTPEYKQRRQEWEQENPDLLKKYRRRKKQKHREKTGYNPEDRTCKDCGADISHMGHRAKRCKTCSTPPARTCTVCGTSIQRRGPSVFCSEQCKIQDRLANEVAGSTKVCLKCKETKPYSAFRLHYGRRDSSCKSCEAAATRNYYQTLPVEERRRRRRIQGERERIKKDNLPPSEKAKLRTKARRAQRRNRYGPEFDENELYFEQGGKCAICESPKSLDQLELDHDHETGRLRGFLCKNCNLKLLPRYEKKFPGRHKDSPRLNEYLRKGSRQ